MQSRFKSHSFADASLLILDHVLYDVLTALKAREPFHDWERDGELKSSLAKKLKGLASTGIIDPAELARRALESIPFDRTARAALGRHTELAESLGGNCAPLERSSALGCRFNRSPQRTLRTSPLVSDTATSFLVAR